MEYITFKKSNCKNCHKCIRHCPVKSIRFSGNQANVIPEECILCGECFVACPQGAKDIVDETEIVSVLLRGDAPVYASVAPSFLSYFEGVGINSLKDALIKLGFTDVEETAIGATIVKREYERLLQEGVQDIIITSCCHTVNLLVEKYYPQLINCLAPVITPMHAHCDDIKRRHPEAKTVFIGPCLSKKDEAAMANVDAALTFDEINSMFKKAGIVPEKAMDNSQHSLARIFPTSGGVLGTLSYRNPDYIYLTIDGVENCIAALDDIARGGVHRCFIEMSSCAGSCIRGPLMRKNKVSPLRGYRATFAYAGKDDFEVSQPPQQRLSDAHPSINLHKLSPSTAQIEEVLHKMGKTSPADELNCGTCGYDTCREKAAAVVQGKAEIDMCLPYLMEKSERFTDTILDNIPNGILVVNDSFEVQQLNRAAMKMMHVNNRSDVLGEPLIRIMDPSDFVLASENIRRIRNKRDYYAEFDSYLEVTIVSDSKSDNLIGIFRDVTDEENARKSHDALSRQTIETADRVVDKQMRIVQEIASLLGETAAETKIALTKLKESIDHDNHQ
ncbi:MAG: 4Fe-4S binding protein [Clostridia bacterium]|nr:4Fe-4S binding protein [Clostridia bacterium]